MSSIQKSSVESKTNSISDSTLIHKCELCNNYFRKCKCYRNMYNNYCLFLKMIIIIIIAYIIYNLINNLDQPSNSFRLVRRY